MANTKTIGSPYVDPSILAQITPASSKEKDARPETPKVNLGIGTDLGSIASATASKEIAIRQEAPKVGLGIHTDNGSLAPAAHRHNTALVLIELQQKVEQINRQSVYQNKIQVEEHVESLKKLHKEKIEVLKEHDINLQNASTWNSIKNIASYFSFATSTILGITGSLNPVVAGILVTSGAIGLINRVLSDTGVWEKLASYFVKEKEAQVQISNYIDTAFSLTSTGLGFFTFGGAYFGTNALLRSSVSWDLAKKAGYYGSSLLLTVSSFGSANVNSKVSKTKSNITRIEGKIKEFSHKIDNGKSNMEETAKENSSIQSKVYSMVTNIIETLRNLISR